MPDFVRTVPAGDNRERQVCSTCQYVAYENPKIVVGSVVVEDGRVLLCRRAIEPRSGFWTLPAGYMEMHETTAEGARREALEEAGADIELEGVLALYDVSRIGQVQVMYKARFATPGIEAGEESLEVRMFGWDEIPWDDLAFPTVRWALNAWRDLGSAPLGAPAGNPVDDRRGTRRIDAVPAL
ncbi:NUDIX domain-containing protein [Acidisphaera sp. L21]|jgi:ADP-ribose pyrophosphatase YjhB (NUDIX family)|uniref:NUDIX hydrolase n=1 Tax=Acidisphaera sp. L21 TaxID=1641851 RepID=UPI00131C6D2F|nr:NUDIX hydrolase [Acidisphaera sp. L21]